MASELSALYEISSLSSAPSPGQFGHEALEKALRLFGVSRFALWSGPPEARQLLSMSGIRDKDRALTLTQNQDDSIFLQSLGANGELGLLFMEKSATITPSERRIYNLFARRIEECLLTLHSTMEQQRAREALALSEKRHRAMFEHTGTAAWILDDDYTVRQVNRRCEDLLGYRKDEVEGKKKWTDFVADPAELEWMLELHHRRRSTGNVDSYEFHLKRQDGAVRTVWATVSLIPESRQIITSLVDITELRETELALRESEEKFRSIFELSRDAAYLVDPDGTFIEVNQAWLDILGCSPEDVAKFDAAHWYADPAERSLFRTRMAESGDVLDDEVKLRRKDGTVFDCQRRNVVQRDQDGNIRAFQGVMRDVTAIRNTERALRESEERFRSLFELSRDAIYFLNSDDMGLWVNQAFVDMFGYSQDELLSLDVTDLYADPADRKDFLHRISESGVVRGEFRVKKKDGTLFVAERTTVALRDLSGRIVRYQGILRDITEDRQRKDALADELTRRRILIEQSTDGIVVLDQDGKVTETNLSFARMLGYSPEEVLRLHVWDWDVPTPQQRLVEMVHTVDESGDHFETQHRRKDGTIYDVEISTNGAMFGGQKLIFCVCRDITKRKQTEKALRESEEKHRSLFEQSIDAVALTAVDGTLLDANPAYLQLHGLEAGAIGNANVRDRYVSEADRNGFLRYMEQHGAIKDAETRLKTAEGTVMDCLRTSVAIRDETGHIKYFQTVVRDVTEQKAAQEDLRRSEERFRSLFEYSMDAIWLLRADGTGSQVNQAWLDLFGYNPEDVPSLNAIDVYANPADREDFLRSIAKTGELRDEVRWKKKDGTEFDCDRSVVALRDESGTIVGFQGILRDVTQQKRNRAELERSHAELRRLAAHLELVREEERAMVAWELHDEIGQTLAVVNADLESLRRLIPDEASKPAYKVLGEIHTLMDGTVERLRRLYGGLMPGMLDDLGLAATIEWQTVDVAKRSNIACHVLRLDEVTLPGQELTLATYRAFMEVLDNALRHSGTTIINVSVERQGNRAIVIVDDNGRGFKDEERRSASSLGMIGIRERLGALGGTIDISNAKGKGTTVRITVPVI